MKLALMSTTTRKEDQELLELADPETTNYQHLS